MTDTPASTPTHSDLPDVVERYQTAHDLHDTDAALGAFTNDAVVIDDGHEHHGAAAIRGWLASAASEFTYTRTLTGAERLAGETWVTHNRLEGDFPGGTVDLAYRFTITDDLISELVISP